MAVGPFVTEAATLFPTTLATKQTLTDTAMAAISVPGRLA